jgi:predicted metal-dependent hydrolase
VFNYFKNNILSAQSKKLTKTATKIINHPEHGEITLRKVKGSRRLGIRLAPLKGISVTVPYSYSWQEAEKFINSRGDWIKEASKETVKLENKQTIFKPRVEFKTYERELAWAKLETKTLHTRLSKNKIHIYYSSDESLETKESQTIIRKAIERALRSEAQIHLLPLLSHYASKYKLKLGKFSLRASRTRWGSCSGHNDISLNIHLLRLPETLMRYVVLHELAHTQEHNHSPKFWQLLDSLCLAELVQSAKTLDKELKNYSPHLY